MPGVEVQCIGEMRSDAGNHKFIQEFSAGNKRIKVILHPAIHSATTRIENTSLNHTPGATTALYERARDVIQAFVTESGESVDYTFSTQVDRMKAWALDQNRGIKVFGWDKFPEEEYGFFFAKKTFCPQ